WKGAAFLAILGGIAGAFAAAIPGFIDFWSLKSPTIFKMALSHMALNVLAALVFICSAFSRGMDAPYSISMTLSAVGIVALVFSGRRGGGRGYVARLAGEGRGGVTGRGYAGTAVASG